MTDPYKVLGVSRDASDDEIKKAYRSVYAAGKLVSAGEGKVFVTCAFRNVPKDFDVMTAHVMLDTQRYERTSYYSDELV